MFAVTASLYCLREFTANNCSDEIESIISEIDTEAWVKFRNWDRDKKPENETWKFETEIRQLNIC